MDHYQAKRNTMGQLHQECISDMKSRFWQIGNHTVSREVICPQPRHASRSFCALDSFNRLGPMMKGILSMPRGDCGLEILSMPRGYYGSEILSMPRGDCGSETLSMPRGDCGSEILDLIFQDYSEDDLEGDDQTSFFCGSPPVRTGNPIIKDAQFIKQTHYPGSPLGMKMRVERGSPSCGSSFGGSPKMRIEGFALA